MAGLFDGTSLEQPVTCGVCGASSLACECPKDTSGAVADRRAMSVRVRREKRRGEMVDGGVSA